LQVAEPGALDSESFRELMKLFEASHIHDDIPKPAFKIRQTKRATFVLSTFAAMLSALVWLLVQKLD
jgi:hypothetical protein